MQKCMYCNSEIHDDRLLTVCDNCGQKVWGQKMFNAIIQNMEEAKKNGDLCHNTSFTEYKDDFNTSTEIK